MVLPTRFERMTYRLGGGCSIQLSYGSTFLITLNYEISKVSSCAIIDDTFEIFGRGRLDLNKRPLPPQGSALPGCATPRQLWTVRWDCPQAVEYSRV